MNLQKRHSVSKLQRQIQKELANLNNRRPCSLTSFPSSDSLRPSFSKSVKSILLEEGAKNRKNKSFKDKSPSPKSFIKETKMGRSQDVIGLNKTRGSMSKLKKKKSQGLSKLFMTMSRKQSEPTQVGSELWQSSGQNIGQIEKLVQRNRKYEQKIEQQRKLIEKLESIIQELGN